MRTSLPSPGLAAPPPPSLSANAANGPAKKKESDDDAFEALTKRFAELKKK